MMAVQVASREDVARIAARGLLEVGAVHIRPAEPFTYTSGLKSPVYVDCRKVISYPRLRSALMQLSVATLVREAGLEAFDVVAGGETAGIPFAAWIADLLALPMVYVRKQPKGFGRNAQIEGAFPEGARVVLVEDLATDGGSKVKFAEALRAAGATVEHTIVLFHHDIFPDSGAALAAGGLRLHALARWRDVLAVAAESGAFAPAEIDAVNEFLAAPLAWSAVRGGIDRLGG
jgi:orotate phosphoribosyltransferase